MNKYFNNSDKILITGGTGFIGRCLVERCLMDTSNIVSISLVGSSVKNQFDGKVEVLQADISNKNQLKSILLGRRFDYVFNLGGYIAHTHYSKGGRNAIESHFTGLLNLIECIEIKCLKGFVQIGSSDEYGNLPAPQKETMRESPISPYSLAKTAASHFMQTLFRTEGFPGVVIRFFLVYGPGQDEKRFLPQIIKGCLNNEEFKTSGGKQLRDFCYIDDAVEGMIKAATTPLSKGHIINIASGSPVTIKEMILKVMSITAGGKPIWGAHPYREGENMELYADISMAKKLLNWEPRTTLEEGLLKTIDYYKRLQVKKI